MNRETESDSLSTEDTTIHGAAREWNNRDGDGGHLRWFNRRFTLAAMSYPNNPPSPYQPPQAYGHHPYQPPPADPLRSVRPPAIAMIIVTVLSLVVIVGYLAVDLIRYAQGLPLVEQNELADQMGPEGILVFRLFWYVVFFAFHGLILLAAVSMMRLRSYGLATTGLILSLIPCCTPCIVLGIPIGIWGLVAINQSHVRGAFQ